MVHRRHLLAVPAAHADGDGVPDQLPGVGRARKATAGPGARRRRPCHVVERPRTTAVAPLLRHRTGSFRSRRQRPSGYLPGTGVGRRSDRSERRRRERQATSSGRPQHGRPGQHRSRRNLTSGSSRSSPASMASSSTTSPCTRCVEPSTGGPGSSIRACSCEPLPGHRAIILPMCAVALP